MKKIYCVSYMPNLTDKSFIRTYCSSMEKALKVYHYFCKFFPVVCEPIEFDVDMWDYLVID